MKRVRRSLSFILAFLFMVTGIQVTGLTVNAKTEWKETEITSLKYDVTVSECEGEEAFGWKAQTASWQEKSQTVELNGEGDYSFTLDLGSEAGMKNLGYVELITESAMKIEVRKLTVNDMYTLSFDSNPILQAGVNNANGLANIWNSSVGAKICQSDNAYLALNQADGAITLYVAEEVEEESAEEESETTESSSEEESSVVEESSEEESSEEVTTEEVTTEEETTEEQTSEELIMEIESITSVKYEVTVDGSNDLASFTWKAQAASWQDKAKTIELDGDGDYSFELAFDYEKGVKNLGFVEVISGSEMTVTVNKMIVNDTYELTYETAPVLQAGVNNANGLANIWNVQPQVKICGNDIAYLALDKQDGAIQLYVEQEEESKEEESTEEDINDAGASLRYVEAMGSGWNLGNSFDGFDGDLSAPDKGELAWGNPSVTRELIAAVKDKGFDSIRMPFTIHRRYTVNENAGEDEYKYVINEDWLRRYKEVVNWAVEEDLYVMINIHHDSWIWLKYWDGDKASEEYRMYTDFWKQLAEYMADLPEQVCFETINEPTFEESGSLTVQQKLDVINRAAYDIIREIKGNEKRMIIMPTLLTNHEKCVPLYNLIKELDDEYIIATVHYYSEWVYSANLGKTGFDEELWQNNGESYTPRDAADYMMDTITKNFVSKGIGVVIGEYGLLGYDASEGCLETGEELKYYEYMNELARQNKVCLMFWDNGSGIDRRDTADYSWKKAEVGAMLQNSMTGRSSYATGLDKLYFEEETKEDVQIPLTLNGNTFTGIDGLTEGIDYTYDSAKAIVTLKKEYVNSMFAKKTGYGTFAELVIKFSSGADWCEYLIKYATPVMGKAEGSKNGIQIPVTFHGSSVRRVTAYQAGGKVGPNSSWWNYLQYDGSFGVDYEKGTINLLSAFFADETVKDGLVKLKVELYDGNIIYIWLTVDGNQVTSSPDMEVAADNIGASEIICLYTGENAIPSQYLYMPKGGSVYGTWIEEETNQGMVTLEGWPCTMKFDTKAHENLVPGGIVLYYMDLEKYIDVTFGIKDAPSVENMEVKASESKKLTISNLAEDAEVTYKSSNTSVATVGEDGKVTAKKAGEAVITVTVKQYNRTDDFEATVTVKAAEVTQNQSGSADDSDDNNQSQSSSNTPQKQKTTKKDTAKQEITQQQVPLALQPVITPQEPVQQSQNTQKPVSEKAEETKVEDTVIEGTVVEAVTEETSEAVSSETEEQESEATTSVEEEKMIVEDESTPLESEPLQKKNSSLPFILIGIMVVVFAVGVVVIYNRKKEDIME